eukprot:3564141-Amphidinium_carterae.1
MTSMRLAISSRIGITKATPSKAYTDVPRKSIDSNPTDSEVRRKRKVNNACNTMLHLCGR